MVFAKSYSAQLARSRHDARGDAPFGAWPAVARSRMILPILIDGLPLATKLGDMPPRRLALIHRANRLPAAILPLLLWACERSEPVVRNSAPSAAAAAPANQGAAPATDDGWIATAGPELLVVLFGRGGTRFAAQRGAPTGEGTDDCERWPLHAFEPATGTAWSVGFASDRVRPIALDSVAMLSPRDSMMLVAEAARLASSVSAPTGPSFQ